MASEFCQIPPTSDTKSILESLPPLPGINRLVDLINSELVNLKTKYTNKITELLALFSEKDICPSSQQIEKFIITRNNIVNQLSKVYNKVDRLSNTISGISNGLQGILTAIGIVSGVVRGITLGSMVIPFPIPGAVSSGISAGQTEIEKFKFKSDGSQKLVPIIGGLISADIALKLFANVLRDLICKIEALDASILECSSKESPNEETSNEETSNEEEKNNLVSIPSEIIEFIEQSVAEQENSLIDTDYKGFTFEIEEVPFSPTVNRKRALALNSDGISLLQTELSFTSTPSILIEELKFVIDRDNLRAN